MINITRGTLISVVDDDESVRESLDGLLKTLGYLVAVFASAECFLQSEAEAKTHCLILDVRLPGMSGPEIQQVLIKRRYKIPIIFITSHEDKEVISRVLANGAVACLPKPFREDALLHAIGLALAS